MTDKSKHTPGPWEAYLADDDGDVYIGDMRDLIVAERASSADAARIVACVNGCDAAGIANPEELVWLMSEAKLILAALDAPQGFDATLVAASLRAALAKLEG